MLHYVSEDFRTKDRSCVTIQKYIWTLHIRVTNSFICFTHFFLSNAMFLHCILIIVDSLLIEMIKKSRDPNHWKSWMFKFLQTIMEHFFF